MRFSRLLAPTLRDDPAEAEVVSHRLLMRAGYIRRLANGVYSYLPLMWRVLRNVENIVREEMDRAGAQELLMPILQPEEVWRASGRWEVYGDLMMRVKDRHDRWYGLAPTAEEVITDIATKEIRSYRQLPVNLYQIQTKYRDELRPRFGLLRGREFIMKDAYSFHVSQEDLDREYAVMAETYARIFERCGLETRKVQSDSGAIGGSVSHEYMVLTRVAAGAQESGENDVFFCNRCGYAANAERAASVLPSATTDGLEVFSNYQENQEVETPDCDTIDKLCTFLKCPPSLICKTLLYIKDETIPFLVMIRGDLEVEETKLKNTVQANEIRLGTAEDIARYFETVKGYIGIGQVALPIEKRIRPQHGPPLSIKEKGHPESDPIPGCRIFYKTKLYGSNGPDFTLIEIGTSYAPIPPTQSTLRTETTSYDSPEKEMPVIADYSIADPKTGRMLTNFVIGYEKTGYHLVKFNWPFVSHGGESLEAILRETARDIARARVGDGCPECEPGALEMTRGIEVGNIFQLGTKYSQSMNATYTAEDGSEQPFVMGCYGIGVSRTAAAAVERFHDAAGIIWPMTLAPYQVILIPVNTQDETQMRLAEDLYAELQATRTESGEKIDVLLDDRDERAGVKFKDADLIGIPIRVTVGRKAGAGLLEIKLRDQAQAEEMPVAEVLPTIQRHIREWRPFAPQPTPV